MRLAAIFTAFIENCCGKEKGPERPHTENLARIAGWGNHQAVDQVRREAMLESRKAPSIYDRFVVDGRSITDRKGRWSDSTVTLPAVYRSPKRKLLDTLKEAASVDHEP